LLAETFYPKEQYAHGMIYLLNRDTIEAYIKVKEIVKMQERIELIDTAGFEYSVKPSQAAGFCLLFPEDTMVFESRDDLVNAIFKSKKEPYSFLLRLKEGNMPLYYFFEEKLEMSGVDQIWVEKPKIISRIDAILSSKKSMNFPFVK